MNVKIVVDTCGHGLISVQKATEYAWYNNISGIYPIFLTYRAVPILPYCCCLGTSEGSTGWFEPGINNSRMILS
jgi:hypothetical protein